MFLKHALQAIDTFFFGIVGINIFHFIGLDVSLTSMWQGIEILPRLIMTLIGIVYFIFRAHHFFHDSKLNRERKALELQELKDKIAKNK